MSSAGCDAVAKKVKIKAVKYLVIRKLVSNFATLLKHENRSIHCYPVGNQGGGWLLMRVARVTKIETDNRINKPKKVKRN